VTIEAEADTPNDCMASVFASVVLLLVCVPAGSAFSRPVALSLRSRARTAQSAITLSKRSHCSSATVTSCGTAESTATRNAEQSCLALSRRELVRIIPAVVAAGITSSALFASKAEAALPRAIQELTDVCESVYHNSV